MAANPTVGIRFTEQDKAALVELSRRLKMSQSNTLRTLVREMLNILKEDESKYSKLNKEAATQ